MEYVINVDLSVSREKAWQAITDFKSYQQWNSVLSMSGNDQLEVGKKFNVTIHTGKKDSRFKAILLSQEKFQSFSARQTIVGRWFFSATHHFILKESASSDHPVQFFQKWELTGIISRLFKTQIFKQLALFKKMNEELKGYLQEALY